jgi:NUBPL iron-transfer P-loop NTPase
VSKPRLCAFYSVKGGVGKTALASVAALGLARRGRPVAVLDADFMGTSIADGLNLRAPDVRDDSGRLSWVGPRRRWLSLEETRTLRRGDAERDQLPWLDGLLVGDERPFDPASIAWTHPDAPEIQWYPSSPRIDDGVRAAERVFYTATAEVVQRIGAIARRIASQLGAGGTVIIDLPPGLYGMPKQVIDAFEMDSTFLDFVPVVVSTPDRSDLFRSVEAFNLLSRAAGGTRWVLNRNREAVELTRKRVREFLGSQWAVSRIEDQLESVGWSGDGLGRLYQSDRLEVDEAMCDRVLELLGLGHK